MFNSFAFFERAQGIGLGRGRLARQLSRPCTPMAAKLKPTPKEKAAKEPSRRRDTKEADDTDERKGKAPETPAQVISLVSLEGLPCPSADVEEAIIQLLTIKYETLAQIFAHYCRASDCSTVKMATSLGLGVCSHWIIIIMCPLIARAYEHWCLLVPDG